MVDYTGRNMQNQVKKKGLPWSAAKGMDTWWQVSFTLLGLVELVPSMLLLQLD